MRMKLKVVMGLVLAWSLAGQGWAEEQVPSPTPAELGAIIAPEGMLPETLAVAEGAAVTLWVVNSTSEQGVVTLDTPEPLQKQIKKNELLELKAGVLKAGDYALAFKGTKLALTTTLKVLPAAPASQEIAIVGGRKQFKPEISRVAAGKPLTIHLYSTVGIPHGDIGIYGTDVKLPLKNKKLEKIEVKDGLAAGTYPISRPGHPDQKHGITSRIVAE